MDIAAITNTIRHVDYKLFPVLEETVKQKFAEGVIYVIDVKSEIKNSVQRQCQLLSGRNMLKYSYLLRIIVLQKRNFP